jgi:hypothetical protein
MDLQQQVWWSSFSASSLGFKVSNALNFNLAWHATCHVGQLAVILCDDHMH